MDTVEQLKKRLDELRREIDETKKRLPAHSVKPPVMMDLLALEDEYDEVFNRLKAMEKVSDKGGSR